jgi:hypothetical protein
MRQETIPEEVAQQNSQAKPNLQVKPNSQAKPKFKNVFSKLSKLKLWRRISATTGGVMTEG